MPSKRTLKEAKQKRGGGAFVPLPFAVLRSQAFARLSPYGMKLLCDLLSQYSLSNNGDLCAAWTLMRPRGWKSKETLSKAIKELLESEWIEVTRQGGRHKASLYAVTFFAIDECGGKLDVKASRSPAGLWGKHEPLPAIRALPKLKVVPRLAGQLPDDCPARRVNYPEATCN